MLNDILYSLEARTPLEGSCYIGVSVLPNGGSEHLTVFLPIRDAYNALIIIPITLINVPNTPTEGF